MSVLIKGMEMPKDLPIAILIWPDGKVCPAGLYKTEEWSDKKAIEIKTPTWSLLDALDGVTWYNGLAEEVFSWAFLPTEGQEDRKEDDLRQNGQIIPGEEICGISGKPGRREVQVCSSQAGKDDEKKTS